MIWLLFGIGACHKAPLSCDYNDIRLPHRDPNGETKPSFLITFNRLHVQFENNDPDYISIQSHAVGRNTTLEIMVEHSGSNSVSAEVMAISGNENLRITVHIDEVRSISIKSTSTDLHTSSDYRFSLKGFDHNGNTFSSLNGLNILWKIIGQTPESVAILDVKETRFEKKPKYNSNQYVFIQPKETGSATLIVTVGKDMSASKKIEIFAPIVFSPESYRILPDESIELKLCNAGVDADGRANKVCTSVIDLQSETNIILSDYDDSIIHADSNGTITGLKKGITRIEARDKNMRSRHTSALIHVYYPNYAKWPEQWIKTKTEKTLLNETIPNVDLITLYNDKGQKINPQNELKWEFVGDFSNEGEHQVIAMNRKIHVNATAIVHTCSKPEFDSKKITIPLGHDNYIFTVKHGSGFFKSFVKNSSVLTISGDNKIITHAVGKTTITVVDQKIPGYKAKLKVRVKELSNIDIEIPFREFYVGEKIFSNVTATYINKKGQKKQFDYVKESIFQVDDENIVGLDSITKKSGFTYIQFRNGNVYSNKVLVSVINPLVVRSPINGTSLKWIHLNRNGGPVRWNGSKQFTQLICGDVNSEINEAKTDIRFKVDYIGECTLIVQNEKTELNPNPLRVNKTFSVISNAITHIGLYLEEDHNEIEQCNSAQYVPSTKILSHIKVPLNQTLRTVLHAFGGKKELGHFDDPNLIISAVGKSGKEYNFDFGDTINITVPEDLKVKISVPEIPPYILNIEAIYPHYINIDNDLFVLYYKEKSVSLNIFEGSGHFEIKGEGADIEDRSITIYPSSRGNNRTVIVKDKCIPENEYKFIVSTESVGSLSIQGLDRGIINHPISLKTTLSSDNTQKISSKSYDLIKWITRVTTKQTITKPHNLKRITSDDWEFIPDTIGRTTIEICADDVCAYHDMDIFSQMRFRNSYMKTYVGEIIPLKLEFVNQDNISILFVSNDTSVINITDENIAVSISPGNATITASVPSMPSMKPCYLHIRVLEIRELILQTSTQTPYVNSFVQIVPLLGTDDGITSPNSVSWKVEGNNKWENLYDKSLIIQGDKEGYVIVTASTPHHVSNTIKLYFDFKLEVETPDHLLLPIGSIYDIKIKDNLPVNYSINYIEGNDICKISKNGKLTVNGIGKFIVVIQYKQQWKVISVTTSMPNKLYLQSQASSALYPRLLDIDGQEYTGKENIDIKPNISYPFLISNGSYTFTIPQNIKTTTHVGFSASFGSSYNLHGSSLLFPYKLLHPQYPTIQRGAKVQFICQSKQQHWKSLNERVATVTNGGYVTAIKSGKSIIQCTPDIYTPILVVDFEAVSLVEVPNTNRTLYKIATQLSSNDVDPSTLQYSNDMDYYCKWDAHACGSIMHLFENNTHYCKIKYHKKHLCPQLSKVKVVVESPNSNLKLTDVINHKYEYKIFGIPSYINISLPDKKNENNIEFSIRPNVSTDVEYFCSDGIRVLPNVEENKIRIETLENFNGYGTIQLEHKESGERVEIVITKGDSKWSSVYLGTHFEKYKGKLPLISTIVLIMVLSFLSIDYFEKLF